jgi:hypothetical protein
MGARRVPDMGQTGARRGPDRVPDGVPNGGQTGPDGGSQMECLTGAMSSATSFLNAMSFV